MSKQVSSMFGILEALVLLKSFCSLKLHRGPENNKLSDKAKREGKGLKKKPIRAFKLLQFWLLGTAAA